MKPETVCDAIRGDVSAYLDDELPSVRAEAFRSHLETCDACRSYVDAIQQARTSVRLQVVEEAPDIADRVVRVVAARGAVERRREQRLDLGRVALVAALVAALLVAGTSLPRDGEDRAVASASEVADSVWGAAAQLTVFSAGYDIVERGWHAQVPVRRFHADLDYRAPDRVRFVLRDLTLYPGPARWPTNDVDLVADGSSWWMREPLGCPAAALPGCAQGGRSIERSAVNRVPFDRSTPMPSDLILPLDSVASSEALQVVGRERRGERETVHVRMPFFQAERLITSFQPGGVWRTYHPLDRVDVWLDDQAWFPVAVEVSAARSPERASWARSMDYAGDRGLLLDAELTSFDLDGRGAVFEVPVAAVRRDGGFSLGEPEAGRVTPSFLAGLDLYATGSVEDRSITAWSRGMAWLRLVKGPPLSPSLPPQGDVVELPSGTAYYTPAALGEARRIDMYTDDASFTFESNLDRDTLIRIASSLPVATRRAPAVATTADRRIRRGGIELARRYAFVAEPGRLPVGYSARHASVSTTPAGRTVSVFYGRAQVLDGDAPIRITQSDAYERLWPSSERFEVIRLRGTTARYSAGRGELEWMEEGIYRSVSAPGFDLPSLVGIAESLG